MSVETLAAALPEELQRKAERVLALACESERPLATAESCTGGLLAALLTDIPGCSHIFERGFVSYSDDAKCDLLGIARDQIDRCGAVSRPVAIAMAQGALDRSRASIALSITGFAGPPGKDDEGEEGLVHFALASKEGKTQAREERFGAIGRQDIRIEALRVALDMIEDALT
ncbi:nicotinamide-nucleotide amidohydrolase family protein [Erythrobacter arachoides]|uniref:Nicotinamide-nucleotide amidohydrolase family protein n=1 Tax=Aurantiacibacter arachoides TaxID=1850444 RepID=A0A844ZYK5_9SPHN|nr:CinA family protein [Aurantiacibacter arachoides]MXO92788.1 nicotinamide-nucleotide amidohydrolase family protein [Aurantiacibacter arachoides]GGD54480.1 competence damage-inducible protein A [Aurantiacibacter arachoides]